MKTVADLNELVGVAKAPLPLFPRETRTAARFPGGPTRVLHVVFSLDAGGMENGVINVANALGSDFEIHFACLEARGRMAGRVSRQERIHVLNKKAGFSPGALGGLAGRVAALRPHVIHTHNLGPLIYGALATCFGKTAPILHGEHSQLSGEDLRTKRRMQRRVFYQAAAAVHTVSRSLAQNLLQADIGLEKRKVHAVINGVDTARFRPRPRQEARERLGLPQDNLLLGIVGRFGPYKRHDVLLDAFEMIHGRGIHPSLLVLGAGGPEEERVRRLFEASPQRSAIHLHGFNDRPETIYPALDLLVVPSVNEGLSNAVLEAMACGVPVLSHACCGSSEAISSGVDGMVSDLSSPVLLADALTKLLNSAALPAMGRRARENAESRFSLNRMVSEYGHLYEKLRENC